MQVKKLFVILWLSFYTLGQVFLPQGNFAYIEQIPRLYADFCHTNHSTNVIDFINEQFLEFGFEDKNEPLEENATKRYNQFVKENHAILQRISLGNLSNYLGITQQSLSRIRAKK
jgi:O-phosphoseryl-tRNA(Cys) synthetase